MASNTYLLKDLGRLAVESVDVFNDYPALRDTPVQAQSMIPMSSIPFRSTHSVRMASSVRSAEAVIFT